MNEMDYGSFKPTPGALSRSYTKYPTQSYDPNARMATTRKEGLSYTGAGGGDVWTPINDQMLGDVDVVQALMGVGQNNLAWGDAQKALGKVSADVYNKAQGSSHALSPEVLSKMWK